MRISDWSSDVCSSDLHSHAFQRAMAGLAEHASPGGKRGDSFWTWREVMYRFVARLTPAQVEAVAAQLYVEMLEAGYTAVRSEEPTSELPSLMSISYAVLCLTKRTRSNTSVTYQHHTSDLPQSHMK